MKNRLNDLNNYLFEALERLTDNECDDIDKEINRAKAVCDIAKTIQANASVQIDAFKAAVDSGLVIKNLPQALGFETL